MAAVPPNVVRACDLVAQQLRRPVIDRSLTYTEGQVLVNFLKTAKVETAQIDDLFNELGRRGLLAEFLQTAHPRWGPFVRTWLAEHDVPWSRVHAHYQYDIRDSIDLYAGFLGGMGVALADVPIMIAKVAKTTLDGKLVEETRKFFSQLEMLLEKDLKTLAEEAIGQWRADYDRYVYSLEWFKAGYLLGTTITNAVLFGKGAVKMVAGLPRFIKMVPASAKAFAATMQKTAGRVIRTVEDAAEYIRDVVGALFVAPNLRHSKWLAAIFTPSELRQLLSGKQFRLVSKFGYELIYVPGKAAEDGAVTLRAGPLPADFVPARSIIIRRNGQVVGRIHDPRSLAKALDGVADEDLDAFLKAFDDPDVPMLEADSKAMRDLVERARKSADFAQTALSFSPHFLVEEFVTRAKKIRDHMVAAAKLAKGQPSAAAFGTAVESAMKPVIDELQKKFKHLLFFRKKKLKEILGSRLPKEQLERTVEQYLRENPQLAEAIGYEKNNLKKVMAASGDTKLGDLEVDLFVMDPSGTQGVLLDWTSVLKIEHWNKNLLYHSLIIDVFRKMRLPLGEMYHFGLGQ